MLSDAVLSQDSKNVICFPLWAYEPYEYQKFEFEEIKFNILLLFAPSSGQMMSYGLEILHADSSHDARGQFSQFKKNAIF